MSAYNLNSLFNIYFDNYIGYKQYIQCNLLLRQYYIFDGVSET